MNQYRRTFVFYTIVWLCLVLLPAAYVLVRGSGIRELRRMYADADQSLIRPLFADPSAPPEGEAPAAEPESR